MKPKTDTELPGSEQELKSSLDFTKTATDHIAVFVAETFGSMMFLILCLLFFTLWICWNLGLLPFLVPFDPFPFPVLDMIVSLFAVILSVSVLINQNRQGKIDQIRQQIEFEVNVRAEDEITKILNMLHEVHQKLGLSANGDEELEKMKERTDIKQLHKTLDDLAPENESLKTDKSL